MSGDEVISGDDHNFAFTFLVTMGMQLLCFFIAYAMKFDKITDLAGSLNFVVLAVLSYLLGGYFYTRQVVVTSLVCVSRLELAAFLLYRVLSREKDARFDAIRESFFPFLGFWFFQMLWVWVCSMPVVFINCDPVKTSPAFGYRDAFGTGIFCLGFVIEVVADWQKYWYRTNIANKDHWCDVGLWFFSRHPNFFGEILMWWGVFALATPVIDASHSKWGYVTILSPLFTMFCLLFLSGIPSAEGQNQARWLRTPEMKREFLQYRKHTSPLVLMFPDMYGSLPLWVKRVFFFEFAMYEMNWDLITATASSSSSHPATPATASTSRYGTTTD